ncbi:MAG: hypothetical protein U0798_08710 [Gemmataceae bacterium]
MKWSWAWLKYWTVMYLINLPLVLLVGMHETRGSERVGFLTAILVMWFFGIPLFLFPGRFRVAFFVGGVIVAIFQSCPIIHYISAVFVITSMKFLIGNDFAQTDLNRFLFSFTHFVLVLQCLAFASLAIGIPLVWLPLKRKPSNAVSEETSPPNQADEATATDTFPE